jgi:hypothetical protein
MTSRQVALLLVAFGVLSLGARKDPVQPTPEQLRGLADEFVRTVAQRRVMLPDGTLGALVATPGSEAPERALLSPERILQAFETIAEAGAWPSAWLVVRDLQREQDLLMTIELQEGRVLDPQAAFVAPRREWASTKEVEAALLSLRGDRVSRRPKNVVLVEFATKTVTTYVYDVKPPDPQHAGLMSFLPQGTLLRAARAVDLGDGRRRTLALVMQEATFHPSDCTSCEAALFGHADSGRVLLVLAGETALEQQLDLTPMLRGVEGAPLVPRFTCEPGDDDPARGALSPKERFGERESVPLLELQDLDGDGARLEIRLPARYVACGKAEWLVASVEPRTGRLEARIP